MDKPTPPPVDNRRLTARVIAEEVMRSLGVLADLHGGDMIGMLIFIGIWTANSQHLNARPDRYAGLLEIAPDSQRRPIPESDLRAQLRMPEHIVAAYVKKLIADGLVERLPGGLVAPSAVFTRPEMMEGAKELYARMIGLAAHLRSAGFALGETPDV
jgi:hypothetical protein